MKKFALTALLGFCMTSSDVQILIEISDYKDPQDKMTLTVITFYNISKQ